MRSKPNASREHGEGNPETRRAALLLIRKAFDAAQRRGSSGDEMTLAVLKNRLLQLTDRTFDVQKFGAKNLTSLLANLHPEVQISGPPANLVVRLDRRAVESAPTPTQTSLTAQSSPQIPAIVVRGRVRDDLWRATVDFTSGKRYVWDPITGFAREAELGDSLPVVPTFTALEFDEWRGEFLDQHVSTLSPADQALALRWRELGLATYLLPAQLQSRWKFEITRRIQERLTSFFKRIDAGTEQEPPLALSPANALKLEETIGDAKKAGDSFLVGVLTLQRLHNVSSRSVDTVFAKVVAAWSSPKDTFQEPASLDEFVASLDTYSSDLVAVALINGLQQCKLLRAEFPDRLGDLAFRMKEKVASIFHVEDRKSPSDVCTAAVAKLEALLVQLDHALAAFVRTSPATAKLPSIEVLRVAHQLYPLLIPAERGFLRDLEVLIGPAFRKLCEAYERNDDSQVIRRAPEFLQNVQNLVPTPSDSRHQSFVWKTYVATVSDHLVRLIEEAMSRGAAALAPELRLRNAATKADLQSSLIAPVFVSFTLANVGRGHAFRIQLSQKASQPSLMSFDVAEPPAPFDLPPSGERLIRIQVSARYNSQPLIVPVEWVCETSLNRPVRFDAEICVDQQVVEPNWDSLITDPPYSLNPVKREDRLYGRESVLRRLGLAAMSGASTFVWGQKRIGKTSLLQVLCTKLNQRADSTCVLLRMGEVSSLHEGEIARLIATRLDERLSRGVPVPTEAEFGAGFSRLIPYVERLNDVVANHKFIVIIDEFDDLDSAFYTGERGKQFVKALRSASEIGLTFFFVGSERMDAIYRRHQADLNKWTNIYLDRIDSRQDCSALITRPVQGAIEYSEQAVDFVIDYCSGNPFYIHNFCYQVFERCLQEHRTFVDDTDTNAVRHQLLKSLGPTNFAHFWEDNPILDPLEKRRAVAENCLALTCLSVLGGRSETIDELVDTQQSLSLGTSEVATTSELRRACDRLMTRKILGRLSKDGELVIELQILREWLAENAIPKLLPVWVEFRAYEADARGTNSTPEQVPLFQDAAQFVIPEDDLLAVSQRLVFCGRQKDVADIRLWLRQFDDDARIELAFQLLRRLAERGFVNEGARGLALTKVEEMIKARRLQIGAKVWKVDPKGRLDNLCVTYVDSELKSGADTARDIRNMMRPGKSATCAEISGWMHSHAGDDPIVAVVDDFAGTGSTLVRGLQRFSEQIGAELWHKYVDEGRVSVFVMYALPEALELVRARNPKLHVVGANVIGDELRALADDAQIFEDAGSLRFAKDVLLQIGRELYPQAPLGFGDVGALFAFHNAVPNNTLPIFWSNGKVGERPWRPLFPRA